PLAGALLRRKLFRLGDRRLASQHTANPGGRAAMIRLAPSCHIARRTGTGSIVLAAEPIRFVVAATMPRMRKVRDFIMLETSRRQSLDRRQVHVAFAVFVDLLQFAARKPAPECRSLFERQSIR